MTASWTIVVESPLAYERMLPFIDDAAYEIADAIAFEEEGPYAVRIVDPEGNLVNGFEYEPDSVEPTETVWVKKVWSPEAARAAADADVIDPPEPLDDPIVRITRDLNGAWVALTGEGYEACRWQLTVDPKADMVVIETALDERGYQVLWDEAEYGLWNISYPVRAA